MNWSDLKKMGYERLNPIYGETESVSILRILHEDLFDKSASLNSLDLSVFNNSIRRLIKYEPVQYITGKAYFMGLKIKVNNSVLIPRFETEEVAELAIKKIGSGKCRVLDIGTGSGCIALAIKKYCPNADVWALDKSKPALLLAQENAQKLNLKLNFIQADFLDQAGWSQLPHNLDLIVSNPPYVAEDELDKMDINTLQYEPHMALFAGKDPLLFYRKMAEFGKIALVLSGKIIAEINEFHSTQTRMIFDSTDYHDVQLIKDMNGKDRILYCWR